MWQIGGDAPVVIQSMTNTPTSDAAATVAQIKALAAAGCQIARCTVPDEVAAAALPQIWQNLPYLSLPTFILITKWLWRRLKLEYMACG